WVEGCRSAGSGLTGEPHAPQNFFSGVSSAPQLAQVVTRRLPHSSQNRAPSRLGAWQRGHFTSALLGDGALQMGGPPRVARPDGRGQGPERARSPPPAESPRLLRTQPVASDLRLDIADEIAVELDPHLVRSTSHRRTVESQTKI